jgi:hypothetical protein
MRPGCPGSWPSVAETERRGYGKLSDVVKTIDMEVLVAVLLDGVLVRERVVSGPDKVNGAETFSVSVYGGPYEPFCKSKFLASEGLRVHVRRGD